MISFPIIEENKPFKDLEEVKAEIRKCDLFGGIRQYACFAFAILRVVGDALNITLVLESTHWFLLSIVAIRNALIPYMRAVAIKHLFGIEAESKKQK